MSCWRLYLSSHVALLLSFALQVKYNLDGYFVSTARAMMCVVKLNVMDVVVILSLTHSLERTGCGQPSEDQHCRDLERDRGKLLDTAIFER